MQLAVSLLLNNTCIAASVIFATSRRADNTDCVNWILSRIIEKSAWGQMGHSRALMCPEDGIFQETNERLFSLASPFTRGARYGDKLLGSAQPSA